MSYDSSIIATPVQADEAVTLDWFGLWIVGLLIYLLCFKVLGSKKRQLANYD